MKQIAAMCWVQVTIGPHDQLSDTNNDISTNTNPGLLLVQPYHVHPLLVLKNCYVEVLACSFTCSHVGYLICTVGMVQFVWPLQVFACHAGPLCTEWVAYHWCSVLGQYLLPSFLPVPIKGKSPTHMQFFIKINTLTYYACIQCTELFSNVHRRLKCHRLSW